MRKGTHHTEETKRIISQKKAGNHYKASWHPKILINCENCGIAFKIWPSCKGKRRFCSKECADYYKIGRPSPRKNYFPSVETKNKISTTLKGRALPESVKRKISESEMGEKNPFFGRKHTNESKIKISNSLKGKRKGTHITVIQKRKISESLKGHPPTNCGGSRGTEKHQKLVNTVASWFREESHCVEVEKPIKITSRHWRIADILVDGKVCFEIGSCEKGKIRELCENGYRVVHMPYEVFG